MVTGLTRMWSVLVRLPENLCNHEQYSSHTSPHLITKIENFFQGKKQRHYFVPMYLSLTGERVCDVSQSIMR